MLDVFNSLEPSAYTRSQLNQTMDSAQWYAIFVGSCGAVLFLLHLHRLTSTAQTYIWIRIAYPLLIRRQHWLRYSVTIFHAALFAVFVAINASLLLPSGRVVRCGTLASVNMIPLFLGGRASFLAEHLGVPLPTYNLAHRAIGTIVIAQGLTHAVMAGVSIKRASPSGFMVFSSLL